MIYENKNTENNTRLIDIIWLRLSFFLMIPSCKNAYTVATKKIYSLSLFYKRCCLWSHNVQHLIKCHLTPSYDHVPSRGKNNSGPTANLFVGSTSVICYCRVSLIAVPVVHSSLLGLTNISRHIPLIRSTSDSH